MPLNPTPPARGGAVKLEGVHAGWPFIFVSGFLNIGFYGLAALLVIGVSRAMRGLKPS